MSGRTFNSIVNRNFSEANFASRNVFFFNRDFSLTRIFSIPLQCAPVVFFFSQVPVAKARDFKRVIQKMELRKIQMISETVQAQTSNLKNRDHEIHELLEHVDWTGGHQRKYMFLENRIACQYISKECVFIDSVLCPGSKNLGKRSLHKIRSEPKILAVYHIIGKPLTLLWKMYVGETAMEILECIKYVGGRRNATVPVS